MADKCKQCGMAHDENESPVQDFTSMNGFRSFRTSRRFCLFVTETLSKLEGEGFPPVLFALSDDGEMETLEVSPDCDESGELEISPLMQKADRLFREQSKSIDYLVFVIPVVNTRGDVPIPEAWFDSNLSSQNRAHVDGPELYLEGKARNLVAIYWLDSRNTKLIGIEYKHSIDGWEFKYPEVMDLDNIYTSKPSKFWDWESFEFLRLSNVFE